MQLGTRWSFGEEPPSRLDAPVVAKIHEAEALLASSIGADEVRDGRWTLTWLERRPIAEFDIPAADGAFYAVTVNPLTGEPVLHTDTPSDDFPTT